MALSMVTVLETVSRDRSEGCNICTVGLSKWYLAEFCIQRRSRQSFPGYRRGHL